MVNFYCETSAGSDSGWRKATNWTESKNKNVDVVAATGSKCRKLHHHGYRTRNRAGWGSFVFLNTTRLIQRSCPTDHLYWLSLIKPTLIDQSGRLTPSITRASHSFYMLSTCKLHANSHQCGVPVQVRRGRGGGACWVELADSPAAGRLVRRKREDVLHCDEEGGDRRQHAESVIQKHLHQSQIK